MSNRSELQSHRATLQAMDAPLEGIVRSVPSGNAATQIARARAMIRAAELLLAGALREQVAGVDDLDTAPWPSAWGATIIHDGGERPSFVDPGEWTGHPDGFAAIAGTRAWGRVRDYRLRADHPYYSRAHAR